VAALNEPFWLIPLLLACCCGLSCPLLGTLLVLQRRVLTTNLMAYAVLPGVVIGQALDLPPLLTGMASALVAVVLVEALIAARRDDAGAAEALLNTVLSASLGLGVLLVQVLERPVDLEGLLFGDLLVAGPDDLVRMGLALVLVLLVIRGRFQQWQWLGMDPDGAEQLELPVRGLRLAMATLTALVVVSATAAVGLALVMALICAPSLAALAGATSLSQALRRAALIGLVVSLVGCVLAVGLNLPPGPLMASCCLPLLFRRGNVAG
jgi:zinc/manganese transport system permease protein